MIEVNDVQAQLNPTRVRHVLCPKSVGEIRLAIRAAERSGSAISVAGCRHAMGGQQFGDGSIHLDMRRFNRVVDFDREKGLIQVESGLVWPDLVAYLHDAQYGARRPWTIRQKQTGVDDVTIGGSLAANIHGRGLNFPPFISDIESFDIVNAQGKLLTCSREENAELFLLAVGGYGLFGVVTHVTLRLVPRTKVKRLVEVIAIKGLLPRVDALAAEGFAYGDCQYSIDLHCDAEFHPGVFSCYKPVAEDTPIPEEQKRLSDADWVGLYTLARTDKQKAFEKYSNYYLGTSGQVYWSDTHQLSNVFQGYSAAVDKRLGTEVITEVYVTREAFIPFMTAVRSDCVAHNVDLTYGTIRFIQKDDESFLSWARESCVCIVCNIHVMHTDDGMKKAADNFRRIIDRAIEFGGRFYLTYHRWATREQVETCYPQFGEFLAFKKKYDPDERFQSDWYRHYVRLFV